MTDNDLRTRLRVHVESTEPPFTLRAAESIDEARTARRRTRFAVFVVALATSAAVVTASVQLGDSALPEDGATDLHPASEEALKGYDPAQLPALIDSQVRHVLEPYLSLGKMELSVLDSESLRLPRYRWSDASMVVARFGGTSDQRLEVVLGHSRASAEGDRDEYCADATQGPDALVLSCTATTREDGTVVVTEISAAIEAVSDPSIDWVTLSRENLWSGTVPLWTLKQRTEDVDRQLDPDEIYFIRSVEAVHSTTFLTNAREVVRAPTYAAAQQMFLVPEAALAEVATDPQLVIPPPEDGSA